MDRGRKNGQASLLPASTEKLPSEFTEERKQENYARSTNIVPFHLVGTRSGKTRAKNMTTSYQTI